MDEFATLQQIAARARRNLTKNTWDYLMGGTETETTLRRNRMALDSLALRPRILRDVAEVDTATSFLGHRIRLPVMLAPIGSLQLIEAGGAVSAAKVAAAYQTIYFCSSVTEPGRDEVGAATSAPKVFQLYVRGDDDWIDEEVKLAIAAGFEMFCLTVDTAYYSRRERDLIKRWRPRARSGSNPSRCRVRALCANGRYERRPCVRRRRPNGPTHRRATARRSTGCSSS